MRDFRPHLPAKETRSPMTLAAAALVRNGTSFAESQKVAASTLGVAYDEAAQWNTVFESDEERIDVASSMTDGAAASRFAVYSQLGNHAPYYWTVDGLDVVGQCTLGEFLKDHCLVDEGSRVSAVDGPLSADDVEILSFDEMVAIPYERFHFAFVDDMPGANWAHPCRYVFIAEDLSGFTVLYRNWLPSLMRRGAQDIISLSPVGDRTEDVYETLDEVKSRVYGYASELEANGISYNVGDKSRAYFVLLSGGAGKVANGIRFWSDTAMLYSTLTKKYGVAKDHIYAYVSDGNSTEEDANLSGGDSPVLVDSPRDLDGDGLEDVTDAATKANLKSCLSDLSGRLEGNDQLFIFMTSHGSSDGTSGEDNHDCRISMFSGPSLRDDELAAWTKNFKCPVAVAVESCYAGGFVDDIRASSRRAIATACNHYEVSWGRGGGGAWSDGKSGKTRAFNCWAGPFNAALRGYWPKPTNANGFPWEDSGSAMSDSNSDGKVSFAEAANFARENDSASEEHPQYSTTDGVGDGFFILNAFQYVTESKSVSLGSSGAMEGTCRLQGRGDAWRLNSQPPQWIKSCSIAGLDGNSASLATGSSVTMTGSLTLEIAAEENLSQTEERSCTIEIYNETDGRIEYEVNVVQRVKDPTYTVTYDPGINGTGALQTAEKVQDVDILLAGAIFTRKGYRQTGWSIVEGGLLSYSLSSHYSANAAITLYPYWTAIACTVTLDQQGGSGGTAKVTAVFGNDMPSITKPSRSGYSFGGYFSGVDGTGVKYYNDNGTSAQAWDIDCATVLYARWIPISYTVTFDRQGGSGGTGSVSAAYGDFMPQIEVPVRTGYTFDGYFSGRNGVGVRYYNSDGTGASAWDKVRSATVYAKWMANTYTVTLDAQGGEGGTANLSVTYASAMPYIMPPSRSGYEFAGYFSGVNGAGTMYYSGNGAGVLAWDIAEDATLYAKWTAFDFAVCEMEAAEGSAVEIRISGGAERFATGVKLMLSYNTAAAADFDLAKGTVDGVTPKGGLKFPLTLDWAAGETGEKVVSIPVKVDKAIENSEFITLQLADPSGLGLGDRRMCTVTVIDPGYAELGAKVADGTATKTEITSWDKLQRSGFYIRAIAEPASAGKVTGSAYCAEGKKVTLKATAAKGFSFVGWRMDGVEDGYVARTPSLVIDRGAKPAASSATSTTITEVDSDVTYSAEFITLEEDRNAIELSVGGIDMDEGTTPVWTNMCAVALNMPLVTESLTAVTVKAQALPAGLKIVQDKASGAYFVTGVPTAASKVNAKTGLATPSKTKFTVTSSGKATKTYSVDWVIEALPAWAVGTFNGAAVGDGGAVEGLVTSFSVAANGKLTAKVQRGATALSYSGTGFDEAVEIIPYLELEGGEGDGLWAPDDRSTVLRATLVAKSGKSAYTNFVAIGESRILCGDESASIGHATGDDWEAWQNLWKAEPWKTLAKPFAKAPQVTTGDGVTLKFAATGAVTAKYLTYSSSSALIPKGGDRYSVFVHFPAKAKFEGYSAEINLVWDGTVFSEE